jgi:hypothetical protein
MSQTKLRCVFVWIGYQASTSIHQTPRQVGTVPQSDVLTQISGNCVLLATRNRAERKTDQCKTQAGKNQTLFSLALRYHVIRSCEAIS